MPDWVVRAIQKEEGEVVPAISQGGDLAMTPEGQQLRGRLLPNRDPEPGEPLLVTGTPGNYLMDTLSWDLAGASTTYSSALSPTSSSILSSPYSSSFPASSLSTYSLVVLDSQIGRRCGLCVTLDDLRAGSREGQRWTYFTDGIITQEEGTVELVRLVPEGLQSVKVGSLGIHRLSFGIYGRERCLQRDRQTGFWAKGKFAVPFPAPLHARTRAYIATDDNNIWYSPGWFQGDPITIPVTEDGRWRVAWQENPRRPSTGIVIQSSGASNVLNVGTFQLGFEFPFAADLVTLVELEICFGNAGLRRINE